MMHVVTILFLSGLFCSLAAGAEKLPAPLKQAFAKIDKIVGDDLKARLKKKDPKQARIDSFGENLEDITNEATYRKILCSLFSYVFK